MVAIGPDRDEARRRRAEVGDRFALLSDAALPRILAAHARQGAVRRYVEPRDEARRRALPGAAAQARAGAVSFPAQGAEPDRQPAARRLWPADKEDRADRSEHRRVGKAGVSTGRCRWSS